MITGNLLIVIFIISIILLLLLIMKFKLNAFISLLITTFVTGLSVRMPFDEITRAVVNGFGNTLGSIGLVTGLGVILGKFMFESGGINSLIVSIINIFGNKKSPIAVAISGFIVGIPVFGDVVYVIFSQMLRALSKNTGISMVAYACAISVGTTCTFALVIPTASPLAVASELGLDIGIFFFYALISAFIGTIFGGIIYSFVLNKQDKKRNHHYSFDDLIEEERDIDNSMRMSALKCISILLVPITLILIGSFGSLAFINNKNLVTILTFFGDKNVAMLMGVIYASIISRKYIRKSVNDIMTEGADKVGLILLITGSGGAFGKILQSTGIAQYIAESFTNLNLPILVLCFIIAQIIRCAQGSTTVALITTSSILSDLILNVSVSPILCAIAICAGGIGLSLPNDSGFWAISRFFRISVKDTIRAWTFAGFIAGVNILLFVSVLSLIENILPGL